MLESQVESVDGMVVFEGAGRVERWREVDASLRSIAKRRSALDVEEAKWLVEARRTEVHRHFGYATLLEYMERVLGYGPHTATERLRVAEDLEQLPQMRDELAGGRLCYSAARELTRVVTPQTEVAWIEAVHGKSLREIEPMVAGRQRGDLPGAPPVPGAILHPVRFEVRGSTLALLRDARIALEDAAGQKLDGDALLAAMCRAVLDPPRERDQGTARHQIAVTTCDTCVRAWQDGSGASIEIDPVSREIAECDAQRIGRLDAKNPKRAKQDIRRSVRRLVWHRDHGRCVVPGCRSAQHLDLHHIVWREHGGDHTAGNLVVMCGAHHTSVHEGRLRVTGRVSTGLRFEHEDGRPYGAPPPADQRREDAVAALRTLGFSRPRARAAVELAASHVGAELPVEDLIRRALQRVADG